MDDLLRERGYRRDFPLKLVKYGQYSPRLSNKSRSIPRPLATAPILGQPPSTPMHKFLQTRKLDLIDIAQITKLKPYLGRST